MVWTPRYACWPVTLKLPTFFNSLAVWQQSALPSDASVLNNCWQLLCYPLGGCSSDLLCLTKANLPHDCQRSRQNARPGPLLQAPWKAKGKPGPPEWGAGGCPQRPAGLSAHAETRGPAGADGSCSRGPAGSTGPLISGMLLLSEQRCKAQVWPHDRRPGSGTGPERSCWGCAADAGSCSQGIAPRDPETHRQHREGSG